MTSRETAVHAAHHRPLEGSEEATDSKPRAGTPYIRVRSGNAEQNAHRPSRACNDESPLELQCVLLIRVAGENVQHAPQEPSTDRAVPNPSVTLSIPRFG